MDIEEAIAFIDQALSDVGLNDLQIQILRQVWTGAKYPDIADSLGYDPNYIKDLGAKIWKQLSQAFDEKITKSNVQSALRRHQNAQALESPNRPPSLPKSHPASEKLDQWPDHIHLSHFVGREAELNLLTGAILKTRDRFIAVYGMAGMGKTSLVAQALSPIQEHFDQMVWRSLQHAPALDSLLTDLLSRLSHQSDAHQGLDLDAKIHHLFENLRQKRCLLVLDQLDSLISARDYQSLLGQLHTIPHQSCVIVICQHLAPPHLPLAPQSDGVKTIQVNGLGMPNVEQLLQLKGHIQGTTEDWATLTEQYSGNPLALNIVATTVLDFFQGSLSDFLAEGQVLYDGLSAFLDNQWQTLTPEEKWILFYLAMRRTAVSFKSIKADCLDLSLQRRLIELLASLERRSLLVRHPNPPVVRFSLASSVLEYVTYQFVQSIHQELLQSQFQLLHQCPLTKINAPAYLQTAQASFILQPILEQYKFTLEAHLNVKLSIYQQLIAIRSNQIAPSYAPGNLINLLIQNQDDLTGLDLTELAFWEVDFSQLKLHGVNLSDCDLSRTKFAHSFGDVTDICCHPNLDQFVTGHSNGLVYLWNSDTVNPILKLSGHQKWIWDAAWTPDGQRILTASEDQTGQVWDANTGQRLHVLNGHKDRVWRIIAINNNIAVSSSADHTTKVWDLNHGQCLLTLKGHTSDVTAIAAISDTLIISGSSDQTIKLWDLTNGKILKTWTTDEGIWAIAYDPSRDHILSAGDSGIVKFWGRDLATPIKCLGQASIRIWTMALSPDCQTLITGGDRQQIDYWNLQDGQWMGCSSNFSGRIWSLDFNHSGQEILTASDDQTIRRWQIQSQQLLTAIHSHTNWACDVKVFKNAQNQPIVISAHGDGNIYLWRPDQTAPDRILAGHQQAVWSIASHGNQIASGSEDQTLRIWDGESGDCQKILRGHRSRIWAIAWSPDGQLIASGSGDRTIKLWASHSGECLKSLDGHTNRIWSLAWHPNNRWLASGSSDGTIKLWDRNLGHCLATYNSQLNPILGLAFNPKTFSLAAVGSNGILELWSDIPNPTSQIIPTPNAQSNWGLDWHPEGNLLAIGGDDHRIHLWDQNQQGWTSTIDGHLGCIWAIAFGQDGQFIASASQDGTTHLRTATSDQYEHIFQPQRPYEDLKLLDVKGLPPAHLENLKNLGAII